MAADLFDFSSIANPLGTPASFTDALNDGDTDSGIHETCEAALEREYGLSGDSLLIGGSTSGLLAAAVGAFPPCTVALPVPVRCEHAAAVLEAGHELVRLSSPTGFVVPDPAFTRRCGFDFDAAILANPSYPTSRLLSMPTLLAYLDVCEWVVVDERSIELSMGGESMAPLTKDHPNLVVVQSLAESFALERTPVGYLIAHPATIDRIRRFGAEVERPPYAEALGHAAINERTHLDSARECLETEIPWMQCMLNLLPGVHIFPAEANYVLCLFDPGTHLRLGVENTDELAAKLHERGFLVRRFADTPSLDERFFCVAVRTRAENTRFISAMKDVIERR